ncbi:LLM class flavin-dependent oxidoreductase [Myceligenerans crystallogenes]|uniref:LLM class flavin-dependent oxidoreductase n=1 Tax=Myceligenerans crystallogenes TaxID=316335 RepID=A0ABP4ZI25_9MICO
MTEAPRIPLSVLDLAIVPEGGSGAAAIRRAVDLAADLDRWGYRRVWYAEHHLSPGVASASPAVLAAAVAARTERIRVGSGAVLLGTTSPVVAAEQFGTIAALHPGRVDLGLGRASVPPRRVDAADGEAAASSSAPSVPAPPAAGRVVDGLYVPPPPPVDFDDPALRDRIDAQQRLIGAGRTPSALAADLEIVLNLRDGGHLTDGGDWVSPPADGAAFDLWVLASSPGESARTAGALGLPLAANYHVSPATTLDTIAAYREAFRPGVLAEPYVIVSADVLAVAEPGQAHEPSGAFADWVASIRSGARGAIPFPAPGRGRPWSDRTGSERALVADRVDTRIVGDPATVVERLATLARVTGADELLVTTEAHDPAAARASFELLAGAWGLAGANPAPGRRTAAA